MIDDDQRPPVQFRLAWRWKTSGVSGKGPWTHRGEIVEGWLESLSRRTGDHVEHWIEITRIQSQRHAERGGRPDSREVTRI